MDSVFAAPVILPSSQTVLKIVRCLKFMIRIPSITNTTYDNRYYIILIMN